MRKKSKSNTISTESVSKCPCGQTIKGRPAWIACDTCGQWWHGSCVSLTKDICGIFKAKNLQYVCPVCIVSKVTGNRELQEKDNCVDNLKSIGARRVFWLIWDTYRSKKVYIR